MQFSLRMLFAAVAVVGIGAALWVAEPSWQVGAIDAIFLAWIYTSAIALSVYSRNRAKVWWMGVAGYCLFAALVCLAPLAFRCSMYVEIPAYALDKQNPALGVVKWFAIVLSGYFRSVLLAMSPAPIVGVLCVATHWLLIRPPQGPQD